MSMLKKAIVDAKQLKEAATANAERIVLKKYSDQIKEELNRLLEQDDELDLNAPLEGDPAGDALGGLGGEETPESNPDIEGMSDQIPLAATENEKVCPCPDDGEQIEIDFDELVAKVDSEPQQTPGELPAEMPLEETYNVPSELGPDLHNYHSSIKDPIYQVGSLALSGQPVSKSMLESAKTQLEELSNSVAPEDLEEVQGLVGKLSELLGPSVPVQEEIPLESQIYEALETVLNDINLEEEVFFDYENLPSGNARNEPIRDQENGIDIEAALLQNEKYKEELKQKNNAFSTLQKEQKELTKNNNYLKQQVNSLNEDINRFKDIAEQAASKLKELVLQNAKLFYQNQALRDFSLNERQRNKVVEVLSKAETVNEAKNTYNLLAENISKRDSKENKNNKSLNELLQGRAQSLTMKSNLNEQKNNSSIDNKEKGRMLELAGIKNNNRRNN